MTLITPQDFDLLSAYLDGELDAPTAQALEERLKSDEALQREWRALQMMVRAMNELPIRTAPRDFSLTPQQAQQARPPVLVIRPSRFAPSRWMMGLASVAMIVLVVGVGVLLNRPTTAPDTVLVASAPTQVPITRILESPAPTIDPISARQAPLASPDALEDSAEMPEIAEMMLDSSATEPIEETADELMFDIFSTELVEEENEALGGEVFSLIAPEDTGEALTMQAFSSEMSDDDANGTDALMPSTAMEMSPPMAQPQVAPPQPREKHQFDDLLDALLGLLRFILQGLSN